MLIIATIFVLFMPIVSAEINLNPLLKTTFNKGDIIKVNGYVISQQGGNFPLTMFLVCDSSQLQFSSKNLNVLPGKTTPIPPSEVTIPFSMSGDCQILVNFGQEQVTTELFKVTKALRGTFNLIPISIQLGDDIQITGTITRLNNDPIDGSGILYIEKDDQNYITTSVQIKNSKFEYKTKVTSIPEGSYHINLAVNDLFGNEEFFANAATLNVYNTFKVSLLVDKQQYNPSDTLKLQGDVQKTVGIKIESAQATISLDGIEYTADVVNNKFEFELPLSSSIKSYYHELNVLVKDDFGNSGEKTVKVYLVPNEIKLESGIEKELFAPKEIITLKPKLYDQAADLITDTLYLTVTDSKNNNVIDKQISSGEDFSFKLNQFASPGVWTYILKSKKLSEQGSFTVDIIEDVDVNLQGQFLKIKNIGNTPYNRDIEILATDAKQFTTSVNVRTNLLPNQEITYPLYKDLESGTYDVYIDNKGLKFQDVNIADSRDPIALTSDFITQATGAVLGTPGTSKNNKPFLVVLFLLLAVIFTTFMMRFRTKARTDYHRNREVRMGQQRLAELKTQAPELKKQSYGKASKDDIKDFQQRIARDLEKNNIRKQSMDDESGDGVRHSIERNIVFDRYRKR